MQASTKLAHALMLALGATSTTAVAAQFDYSLYSGIEHSDNIALTTTNPISQNVLIPGMNFTFQQQGSTIQANVAGNLEYRDYLGGKFQNQTQTELAAQANWTIAPERLDLAVQDYAGVQPINRLAADSPGNQQQTNVLTVGPNFYFRLGDTLHGQAELRYINSYAQKSTDFNSKRGQASLRLLKDLNPTDQLSANIESQRIVFTTDGRNSNYNRQEIFGGYVSHLTYFDINAALGWSQLDFDQANTPQASGLLARLNLSWRPTLRSTFVVSALHQYSDAAQDMALQPDQVIAGTGRGISIGNAVINSQVYLDRELQLTYGFHSERLTLSVAPLYRKLGYVNDPAYDQTGRGGSASIDYRLQPTVTVSFSASQERLDYDNISRRDKTFNYGVSLSQQVTPHWGWRGSFIRQRRDSSELGQGFHENEIYVGVVFKR